MAAPFRNNLNFHNQEYDQNANFRARYHVSTHRNQLPGSDFHNSFRPRFQNQLERPRNRFEGPRWQGNDVMPNSFQRPPPHIGQRFDYTTPSTGKLYGVEQPGFTQSTGNLETPPRLPIMGDIAIQQYGTRNSSSVDYQNNDVIPNFQNPAMQSSQPMPRHPHNLPPPNSMPQPPHNLPPPNSMPQPPHNLPPPNSMRFSAPPPRAVPQIPPSQCAVPPMPPSHCAVPPSQFAVPSMPPSQCAVPPSQFAVPPMPPPPSHILPMPPPTFTPDSGPNFTPKKTMDDATAAKQCLDVWIRKRQRGRRDQDEGDHRVENVSIHSTQSKMRRMMLLMAQLQQETNELSDLETSVTDEVWNSQKQKILSLKAELKEIQQELSDEPTVDRVKQKVLKQRKKRERLKRKRKELYEEKQAAEEHRNKLHAEMDAWQEKLRMKEREAKEAKELKKSADTILNEVRKKISDVTKTIELLKGIQKLRKLRSDRLKQQGVYTNPVSDEKFKDVLDEQFVTIKKQKEIYLAEEKALQVMLETEHEVSKEKEREEQEKAKQRLEECKNKKIQESLFGKTENFSEEDPMLPFYQYYDQANYSYEAFIQIRQEWDRFAVPENTPGGNRIPAHFVTPEEPSSEKWSTVLKDT